MTTILIIDDEPELCEILSENINEIYPDIITIQATTSQQASDNIILCDIILSDVNVPDPQHLEKILAESGKPVARCSGNLSYECELFLPKPFSIEQVRFVIDKLLVLCGNARRD